MSIPRMRFNLWLGDLHHFHKLNSLLSIATSLVTQTYKFKNKRKVQVKKGSKWPFLLISKPLLISSRSMMILKPIIMHSTPYWTSSMSFLCKRATILKSLKWTRSQTWNRFFPRLLKWKSISLTILHSQSALWSQICSDWYLKCHNSKLMKN